MTGFEPPTSGTALPTEPLPKEPFPLFLFRYRHSGRSVRFESLPRGTVSGPEASRETGDEGGTEAAEVPIPLSCSFAV